MVDVRLTRSTASSSLIALMVACWRQRIRMAVATTVIRATIINRSKVMRPSISETRPIGEVEAFLDDDRLVLSFY